MPLKCLVSNPSDFEGFSYVFNSLEGAMSSVSAFDILQHKTGINFSFYNKSKGRKFDVYIECFCRGKFSLEIETKGAVLNLDNTYGSTMGGTIIATPVQITLLLVKLCEEEKDVLFYL